MSVADPPAAKNIEPVRIGKRLVGPGQPTYVVAEAGVNHNGNLGDALRLVEQAARAGADAVKFQVFTATKLASRQAESVQYQKKANADSQQDMLKKLELDADALATIKHKCDEMGVEFLATPFTIEDLETVLRLGVRAVKIASTDIVNLPLLEAVAENHLPVILSTGASEGPEIDAAYDLLVRRKHLPLVMLHCVSSYPTAVESANLRRIGTLRARYAVPVGFSDHTAEAFTGAWAVAGGAAMLEKHFTLDRTAPGPDHFFSLEPSQLAEYIRQARLAEKALGSGRLEPDESELEVRRLARCSIVAAVDIPAKTRITRHMVTFKRPGWGIPPAALPTVLGRVAKQHIAADTVITWDMLEQDG